MTGKALACLLGVLISLQPACDALECFNCKSIGDVHDCNITSVCSSGESCSTVSAQPTAKGTARFSMGCIQNQLCGNTNTAGIAVGKRQSNHCDECCSSDHCNSALCSHLQPSACVDDETADCAKMHSLFQICKDIQHAKLVCPRFCGLCNVVDGNWANWSNWSLCDVTCGNGTQVRARTCTDPAPAHGGAYCSGPHSQNKPCLKDVCPVNGGWSTWSVWGACSSTCDIGIQRRDRSCSNPYPSRFGDHCFGDSRDDRICITQPCANGGWTSWDNWSTCTVTCGGGIRSKSRSCTNPKPSVLGQYCNGIPLQTEQCGNKICPDHISAFSVGNPYNYTDKLTFSRIIYQHGNDFDQSTGTFTCSIPGIYHFSVTLVKKRENSRVDRVFCELSKNGGSLTHIEVDPTDDDTDKGSAAVSESMVIHLDRGDKVYLSSCNGQPSTYMAYWSSFTGFLLHPDN